METVPGVSQTKWASVGFRGSSSMISVSQHSSGPLPPGGSPMAWRLIVIDGADAKQLFPLPAAGAVVIGKETAGANIVLHDFYVEKTHCKVEIKSEGISALDLSQDRGIFINGTKVIGRQAMRLREGDILRVGNSYLRLEPFDGEPAETPSGEFAAPTSPHPQSGRLIDLQGHTLGNFELGTVLGKGFHGATFRAVDKQNDRRVALKVLSPDFPQSSAELQRFAAAIKSLAHLEHPNLVPWYGAGRSGKFTWISQEIVEGENLTAQFSLPETARSTWRSGWRLAHDILLALEFLREKNTSHGNITAANIIFEVNGGVRLNDLRLQQALEGSALQKRVMERKLIAELTYMPPERLVPGAFVDDHVADIYSLGVAVFTRFNGGQPPFQGDTPEEIIEQIQAGFPEKPRKRIHGVPDGIMKIVLKMLARDQENRYQTAADVLFDLAPFDDAG